jgi:hypothetical protein
LITLKKNEDNVTFGDNGTSNIVGKGTFSLDNGRDKVDKVIFVKDVKHNLLSVSNMCDQGQTLTLDSQECKIRKESSGKLVTKAIRTQNNVYIIDEVNGEKRFMGQTDEIWLWHKRMGHMNFENLVKINTKQAIRDMPKITKPSNTICKQCQHGRLSRMSFKTKNIQRPNHWRLCIHISMDQQEQKFCKDRIILCYSSMIIQE